MNKIKEFFAKVPKKKLGWLLLFFASVKELIFSLDGLVYPYGQGFFLFLQKNLLNISPNALLVIFLLFLILLLTFISSYIFTLTIKNWIKNTAQFLLVLIIVFVILMFTFVDESLVHYPISENRTTPEPY